MILTYIDDCDKKIRDKYETMVQRIETTLVNGRRATMTNYKQFVQNSNCDNQEGKSFMNKKSFIFLLTNRYDLITSLNLMNFTKS